MTWNLQFVAKSTNPTSALKLSETNDQWCKNTAL